MTVDYYYVPLDESLVSDAPGYGAAPVCWKCRNNTSKRQQVGVCKICHGVGRLSPRKVVDRPGKITRGRRPSEGENIIETNQKADLPRPAGYSIPLYGTVAQTCTEECTDHVCGSTEQTDTAPSPASTASESNSRSEPPPPPVWWPHTNEELCNLTGNGWRILQRVRSHRWTTDDIVTAAVAVRQCGLHDRNDIQSYLDLGCGNGSVLQMVLSQCKSLPPTAVVGVEARSEAVSLARRSLAFNLGAENPVQIHHSDFRGFSDASSRHSFDLITGTPPYFAVGRHGGANQGGMPSAVQSAPARCEFRGGFEAYCSTARRCTTSSAATFVVCENYLNHNRALRALRTHGWAVREILIIRGKVGREPLFVVYTSGPRRCAEKTNSENESIEQAPQQRELAVRNLNGEWTEEYKTEILRFMSVL